MTRSRLVLCLIVVVARSSAAQLPPAPTPPPPGPPTYQLAVPPSPSIALPATPPSAQTPAPPPPRPFAPVILSPEDQALAGPGTPSGPQQTLNLDQAIALARTNSPALLGAAATSSRATAAIRSAGVYTNPLVEVFAGKQSARPIATPGIPGLLTHYAAYQAIEIPAERRARIRTARLADVSTRFGQAAVELAVVAGAKRSFFQVLRRREEIDHARENLALVQDLRRRVEVEVRVGEKGRLELTRAEAELARARFAVRSAQIEYATSIADLRASIAASPDLNLDPQGALDPVLRLGPLPELRETVLRTHPALRQTETDVQAAQASLTRERAVRIPQPLLFGEYERQPDLTFWRSGVTIQLPLWNRNQGRIAESEAAIRQSGALISQRRLELTASLERAYEQYQLADQQATSLESGSLHEAESAVEAAKAAYRFGERGIVEVLDAQRVLQSVRGDLLDAQFARQFALVDLQELGAVTSAGRP